ncbi:DUF2637 domain-containing protein [Streptomyces sp. 891-h]|uniref:DUF2637 domain-containing protein n=1 Tax=Streptomyces sp. 891-h TaxID=2720714 RepID=UPI001FA9E66B|nr:DUF2637 domain-containing protein [Streptomyces sp. 891-h]UNZ22293.1 DUF2637 domain-containing protein [Streptomyces sp. 891-h]
MQEPQTVPAEPPAAEAAPATPQKWVRPGLSRVEWTFVGLIAVGAAVVGAIGLYSSFGNVTKHMAERGFHHPELVPLAVDIAIPVFGLAYLVLLRLDMALAWVRLVPVALTGVTIYLNVTSTQDIDAQVAHAALPMLWVFFTEVVAHFYRVQIGRSKQTRTDPIPFKRWLLALPSTFKLWRRMQLWEITSYHQALDMERERVRAVTQLRMTYGKSWRRKAPLDLRTELRLGLLTPHQVKPVEQSTAPAEQAPTEAASDPAPALPAQRELSPAEAASAPAIETLSVDAIEGDTPYTAQAAEWGTTPAQTATVETSAEREQREEQEREQRRADNYERAVEVALEYIEANRPITGTALADDERIPVGARSAQRYLGRMVKEGIVPAEMVQRAR